jgi:AraC-like DNA-binding protein
MVVLLRTNDLPPAQRRDAWRHIVCDTLGPLDMRIHSDEPPRGEIAAGQLGAVRVANVRTATAHSVHRTPRLIRSDSPEFYRVVVPLAGTHHLAQDGRTAALTPGDFTIYDFTRPYELAYQSAVHLVVVSFPHALLPFPVDAVATLSAMPVSGRDGVGALVAPLLRRAVNDVDVYPPATAERLSGVLVDLLTTAIAERLDRPAKVRPETRQRAMATRVRAFIEAHLTDPDLSPGRVASAHHLSLRQLHRLFAGEEATVAAWIRHRRLEQCRTDLADPCLRSLPVGAIAARWGLTDRAQFSRLFRARYGLPPTEYRQSNSRP